MGASPDQHYFSPSPRARSRRQEIELALPDLHLRLVTDRGVFSPDRVDPGTKYLLLEAPMPDPESTATVGDVGCGYGPIAITIARRAPRAVVWAVDVNDRARELAIENAQHASVANVRVVAPDEVPSGQRFDLLYANPPIRIGKEPLHALLREWLGRLHPGGRAYLVVQKHLGADSLARWLAEEGWPVVRLGSRQAYRLLEVGG